MPATQDSTATRKRLHTTLIDSLSEFDYDDDDSRNSFTRESPADHLESENSELDMDCIDSADISDMRGCSWDEDRDACDSELSAPSHQNNSRNKRQKVMHSSKSPQQPSPNIAINTVMSDRDLQRTRAQGFVANAVHSEQLRQAKTLLNLLPEAALAWDPASGTSKANEMPVAITYVYASGLSKVQAQQWLRARIERLKDRDLQQRLVSHLDSWWDHVEAQYPVGSQIGNYLESMWFKTLHTIVWDALTPAERCTWSLPTQKERLQAIMSNSQRGLAAAHVTDGSEGHHLESVSQVELLTQDDDAITSPGSEANTTSIQTFYDDKHVLLQNVSMEADVRAWMIGCLAYIEDKEQWFKRTRSAGWQPLEVNGKNVFPFLSMSTASWIPKVNAEGETTQRSFKDILMDLKDHADFNTCRFTTAEFLPYFRKLDASDPHVRIFNTFRGWKHPVDSETSMAGDMYIIDLNQIQFDQDVQRVNDHLLDLCGRNVTLCDYVQKWLASIVQLPQDKLPVVVFYSKEEGVGKNILQSLLQLVFGEQYVKPLQTTRSILGNFNTASEGKLLTIINECKQDGASILDNEQFKALITDKDCDVNGKFQAERAIKNYSRYMMFSNNKYCCRVGKGRRYVLAECNGAHVGDAAYFKALCDQILRVDVGCKYFQWLAQVDLSEFVPSQIPESQLKLDVRRDQMSSALKHICDIIENNRNLQGQLKNGWSSAVLPVKTLYDDYRSWCAEEGLQMQYQLKQSRYKEQLTDDLGLSWKQHRTAEGRLTGFLLVRDELESAMAKATKIAGFKFACAEVDHD